MAESKEEWRQKRGSPTSNCHCLGRFERGKKRDAEEECRVFIGEGTEWPLRSPGCGIVGEIKTTVSSERKRLGVEGGSDQWVPPVGEGERGGLYRFRRRVRWATGSFSDLGRGVPRVPFLFFF
jgi:hypothetical protein